MSTRLATSISVPSYCGDRNSGFQESADGDFESDRNAAGKWLCQGNDLLDHIK